MDEIILKATLARNCKEHGQRVNELIAAYDMAQLGVEVHEQEVRDIENELLRQHEFYAAKDCDPIGIKTGDRILDEEDTFLLSESDWQRLWHDYVSPELLRRGVTDKDGYDAVPWYTIRGNAFRELVDFIIYNIIPVSMRRVFIDHRDNVTHMKKLVELTRAAYTRAA